MQFHCIMKNAIVLIVLSLLSVLSFGQNQKQYNQFIQCQGLLNPAYSGTREDLSGLVLYRKQWVNFDGAPETEAINVHSPIKFTHLGFGLSATNENIGLNHIFDCYGSAA